MHALILLVLFSAALSAPLRRPNVPIGEAALPMRRTYYTFRGPNLVHNHQQQRRKKNTEAPKRSSLPRFLQVRETDINTYPDSADVLFPPSNHSGKPSSNPFIKIPLGFKPVPKIHASLLPFHGPYPDLPAPGGPNTIQLPKPNVPAYAPFIPSQNSSSIPKTPGTMNTPVTSEPLTSNPNLSIPSAGENEPSALTGPQLNQPVVSTLGEFQTTNATKPFVAPKPKQVIQKPRPLVGLNATALVADLAAGAAGAVGTADGGEVINPDRRAQVETGLKKVYDTLGLGNADVGTRGLGRI